MLGTLAASGVRSNRDGGPPCGGVVPQTDFWFPRVGQVLYFDHAFSQVDDERGTLVCISVKVAGPAAGCGNETKMVYCAIRGRGTRACSIWCVEARGESCSGAQPGVMSVAVSFGNEHVGERVGKADINLPAIELTGEDS